MADSESLYLVVTTFIVMYFLQALQVSAVIGTENHGTTASHRHCRELEKLAPIPTASNLPILHEMVLNLGTSAPQKPANST